MKRVIDKIGVGDMFEIVEGSKSDDEALGKLLRWEDLYKDGYWHGVHGKTVAGRAEDWPEAFRKGYEAGHHDMGR